MRPLLARALCAKPSPATSSSSRSWDSLGVLPELAEVLVNKCGFSKPSLPQRLALPPLLSGKSVAFASSTGSGKTLAFLLPMLQRLRLQELENPSLRQGNRTQPRAIILAPTRDLVTQIGAVAKELSHHFRVRVRTAEAGMQLAKTRQTLEGGADLIVATPDRLALLHSEGDVSLRQVRHIALDEADEMLLRGFQEPFDYILSRCVKKSQSDFQYSFASATLGKDVQHQLRRSFPQVEVLIGNCAHKPPDSLSHELVGVVGHDKLDELRRVVNDLSGLSDGISGSGAQGGARVAAHVHSDDDDDDDEAKAYSAAAFADEDEDDADAFASLPRTLIFCRGVQSARRVQHALVADGLPAGGCHGSMPEETRKADLRAFTAEPPRLKILVCTDLSARGIDLPGVARVVNFDFPVTSALYLHRAGRTARMGRPGHVISLVHTSERRFAESIRDAIERESELHVVRKGDLRERLREQGPRERRGKAAVRSKVAQERARINYNRPRSHVAGEKPTQSRAAAGKAAARRRASAASRR